MAFANAGKMAEQTTRDIFNQFGMTRFDPSTGWNTANAAGAFDPTKIMNFSGGVASINQGALDAAQAGKFGTSMGYGALASAMGQSADNEYAAVQNVRSRGLGGGGLANQARAAAESQQGRAQAQVGKDLISALSKTYGDLGGSYNNYQSALSGQAAASAAQSSATAAETPTNTPGTQESSISILPLADRQAYTKLGTPTGNVPTSPVAGQLYTGTMGVTWVYRPQGPSGAGWYKQ